MRYVCTHARTHRHRIDNYHIKRSIVVCVFVWISDEESREREKTYRQVDVWVNVRHVRCMRIFLVKIQNSSSSNKSAFSNSRVKIRRMFFYIHTHARASRSCRMYLLYSRSLWHHPNHQKIDSKWNVVFSGGGIFFFQKKPHTQNWSY